jgi:hypothetical protein
LSLPERHLQCQSLCSPEWGKEGRENPGKGRAPEAAFEGFLSDVDGLPLCSLCAFLLEPGCALLELFEVLEQARRVTQGGGFALFTTRGSRGAPFAVEVLAFESALDLLTDLVFLLTELLQFGCDALLDVGVEGLLA